ncbi:hypothetical protein [Nocardiopsis quinghaiensis]|uniref:hypothetical protein n=1 Tax=Nocardiopsis quinghaiensis TaxID=464995 RepID=UPI00123844A1|nr:hypothetical protein [Nocardiopsis quinghaiensis]
MDSFVEAHGGDPAGTEAHFLVEQVIGGVNIGFASLRNVDPGTGEGEIEMVVKDDLVSGLAIESNLLLINHIFSERSLEKLHFWPLKKHSSTMEAYPAMIREVTDPSPELAQRAAGRRTFAIERQEWEKIGTVFLRVLSRS